MTAAHPVVVVPYTTEAAWLAARRQDVTSTESAALFGLSPYATNFEVWHRKHSNLETEFQQNERMAWGNRLEAAIAAGIAEERGWVIEPMKDYMRLPVERIGASFDFRILTHPGGPAHLEIKNVDYLAFRDNWLEHDDGTIEAPAHIEMQVQHQMLVSGYSRAFIGALIGGNRHVVIERERDEAVIRAIRARVAAFWKSVDEHDEPPPVMPEDAAAVIQLHQYAEPGKVIDVTTNDEIVELVKQYQYAKARERGYKEEADVLKAEILIAVGDAEKVIGPDWSLSTSIVSGTPPTEITAEMIGKTYGGREGYRQLRVNKRKPK